jgi:hypothetical protein
MNGINAIANSIEYIRFISVFIYLIWEIPEPLWFYDFKHYVSVDYLLTPLLLEGEEEDDLEPEDPLELLDDLPEDPL